MSTNNMSTDSSLKLLTLSHIFVLSSEFQQHRGGLELSQQQHANAFVEQVLGLRQQLPGRPTIRCFLCTSYAFVRLQSHKQKSPHKYSINLHKVSRPCLKSVSKADFNFFFQSICTGNLTYEATNGNAANELRKK